MVCYVGRRISYHVENVLSTCGLYNVCFGFGVTIATSGTRANEERSREVVSEDACAVCC